MESSKETYPWRPSIFPLWPHFLLCILLVLSPKSVLHYSASRGSISPRTDSYCKGTQLSRSIPVDSLIRECADFALEHLNHPLVERFPLFFIKAGDAGKLTGRQTVRGALSKRFLLFFLCPRPHHVLLAANFEVKAEKLQPTWTKLWAVTKVRCVISLLIYSNGLSHIVLCMTNAPVLNRIKNSHTDNLSWVLVTGEKTKSTIGIVNIAYKLLRHMFINEIIDYRIILLTWDKLIG